MSTHPPISLAPAAPAGRAATLEVVVAHGATAARAADLLVDALGREGFDAHSWDEERQDAPAARAIIAVASGEAPARFAGRLRARCPGAAIVTLGGHDAQERVAALDAGADDCVAPGAPPAEVAARVRAVLRRRRPLEALAA